MPPTRLGLLDGAAGEIKLALAGDPDNPSLTNQLGTIYLATGNHKTAGKCFQKTVDICQARLSKLNLQLANSQGRSAKTELIGVSRLACALHVELTAARGNLARLYAAAGQHQQAAGELDRLACAQLLPELPQHGAEKILIGDRKTPGDSQSAYAGLLSRGEALMGRKAFPAAIAAFKKAADLCPAEALAAHQLGLAYSFAGEHELAVEAFQKATRLNGRDAVAHNNLGLALEMTGQPDSAAHAYRKAMDLDANLVQAGINLGNLHAASGQLQRAEQILTETVRGNSESAIARNNLATILAARGQHRQAAYQFKQAIERDHNLASSHYGLGVALFNIEDYRPAISEFKTALSLDPGLAAAHARLESATRKAALSQGSVMGAN